MHFAFHSMLTALRKSLMHYLLFSSQTFYLQTQNIYNWHFSFVLGEGGLFFCVFFGWAILNTMNHINRQQKNN